jgi:hypothetical protein
MIMASSLVFLKFETPEGAEKGLALAVNLQKQHLLRGFQPALLLILIGLVATGPRIQAQERPGDAKQTRLVLRISKEFISQHRLPIIEETSPIDMCVFGSHVTGTAHTVGQTSVNLETNETDAVFIFQFKGRTDSQQVAIRRPVVVCSSGTTDFDTRRAIHFNGVRFTADPATIDARTCTTIDSVETPPGLIGRVVQRIAWQRIDQTKPAADALASKDVKTKVLSSFDKETDRLVKELNGLVPYEKTIAYLIPDTRGWITHLGTTKQYLIISPGPKEAAIATLPKEGQRMRAALEIWIRGKPEGPRARQLLDDWNVVDRALDRFRDALTGKKTKKEGLTFAVVGDWWVVRVGENLLDQGIEKIEEKSKESMRPRHFASRSRAPTSLPAGAARSRTGSQRRQEGG